MSAYLDDADAPPAGAGFPAWTTTTRKDDPHLTPAQREVLGHQDEPAYGRFHTRPNKFGRLDWKQRPPEAAA